MNQNILINFPSRGRPLRFKEALDSIITNTIQPSKMLIFVKCDEDDKELKHYEAIINSYHSGNNIRLDIGRSSNKIDAINRGIENIERYYQFKFDVIVTFSDDMVVTLKGFDNLIRSVFTKKFPDTDGYPVFRDQYRKTEPLDLPTMDVKGRKYYDRFGFVYHPDYISLYCDDENLKVSKILNKYLFIPSPIIYSHNHPNNVALVERDKQYQQTESYYKVDYETFLKRQAKNFDL